MKIDCSRQDSLEVEVISPSMKKQSEKNEKNESEVGQWRP